MFVRYDEFTKDSFNTIKKNAIKDVLAILTSLYFVDCTANDITSEQKRSIPAYKLTDEMTTYQGGTGLYTTGSRVRRIFVKKENRPKWRLSELS